MRPRKSPPCPVFKAHHWPVRILFVPSREAWDGVMRELGIDQPYTTTEGRVVCVGHAGHDPRFYIQLGDACDKYTRDEVIGLLAHECVHVAQEVKAALGGPLGDEPEAYFVQALLVWLFGEYRAAGRKWRGK